LTSADVWFVESEKTLNPKPGTGKALPDVVSLKRLELSGAVERLEQLERTDPVVNGAKRLNNWNLWNGLVPVGSSWQRLNKSYPFNRLLRAVEKLNDDLHLC
jgi:hypothetical protein